MMNAPMIDVRSRLEDAKGHQYGEEKP